MTSSNVQSTPANASSVSPKVSESDGWGWTSAAASSAVALPVHRVVAGAQLFGHPRTGHVHAEYLAASSVGPLFGDDLDDAFGSPMIWARELPPKGSFFTTTS